MNPDTQALTPIPELLQRLPGLHGGCPQPKNHPELAPWRETSRMAKSSPEKKAPPELRVLPMELRLGDRLADERSEWQVIGRPYTTAAARRPTYASNR